MDYIALEEAFDIPDPGGPAPVWDGLPLRKDFLDQVLTRLTDITEFRLPDMDANGIAVQVLSLTVPGIQRPGQTPHEARDNARYANDWLARATAGHADRFRGFAALPMQDPAMAVDELTRCVGEHGFVGALVNDHTDGSYLDEERYDEFWAALECLGVPLYIHPGTPPADSWHVLQGHPELHGAVWSWAAEVAGHALRIMFSGVFDRHPGVTVVLGHMGEFLPFQVSRLDSRYRTLDLERPLAKLPSAYLGTNIKITTSGVFGPAALEGAIRCIGADNVMFSVDYPWESNREAVEQFERTSLTDAARHRIAYGNAAALLGI